MHFNEHIHTKFLSAVHEVLKQGWFKYRADQQDGIRTRAASLIDLIRVEQEILSKQRWAIGKRVSNAAKVTQRTQEMLRVCEDGDRGRSGVGVYLGERDGVEVGS